MTDTNNNRDVSREVFWRFDEAYHRGHDRYIPWARRLEDIYLGGGRQWLDTDRAVRESEGRPCREVNVVFPSVNAAAGYQIANRVDISYLPKGGRADEQTAKVMGKVVKHVLENTRYRYAETQAFIDGLIQQRGYLDVRMDYSDSLMGEPKIVPLDPMDVVPDPDATSYNPDDWADVHITRWLTAREIESIYGQAAAESVVGAWHGYCHEQNWGSELVRREGFGDGLPSGYSQGRGWYGENKYTRRYRLVDQQQHEFVNSLVAVFPGGDFRVVEGYSREHLAWLIDNGVSIITRRMRRVRWRVCAPEVCFYDQLSPYDHFTVVPYFPYFRRGRTVGMIDNMVSPQEVLNKFVSQYEHVINTGANGGWQGEANSLANMTDDEFVARGAEPGLVLLRKANTAPMERIPAGTVPTGIDKMIDTTANHLNVVSGVDPNGTYVDRSDLSGVALQSLEYMQQKKLAMGLDNLSQTRHMLADRVREMVQKFMGQERIIRITEVDTFGVERRVPLALNVRQDDGNVLNDLTVGEYDIAVAERPANVTFNNSEFEQLKSMVKDMGLPIPPAVIVRASNLADKSEIADALQAQEGNTDPRVEAEALLIQAQARLADAKAVGENVKALFAGIQTAQAIVVTPQSAALADQIVQSAGFVDRNPAPVYPAAPAGMQPAALGAPGDTSPLTPASPVNPEAGAAAGMTDAPTQPPQ